MYRAASIWPPHGHPERSAGTLPPKWQGQGQRLRQVSAGTETMTHPLPVGYGKGRRTNRIAVVRGNPAAAWKTPRYLGVWAATEGMDIWSRLAAEGLLGASDALAFGVVWHGRSVGESMEQFVDGVGPDQVDAVVVLERDPKLLSLLAERGQTHALAFARSDDLSLPWAACDNAGGVEQVVKHLVNLGHHRFAFLSSNKGHADHEERERAFLTTTEHLGLPLDPALVKRVPDDMSSETTAGAMRLLHREERPTAVVCANDALAVGVVDACWSLGLRVPQDVAVVGFDDIGDAGHMIPSLTTVRQPVAEIAGYACYLAACAVVGQVPDSGWQMDLPVKLVVRESCGARAAGGEPAGIESQGGQAMRQEPELRLRQLEAVNQEMQDFLSVASHDLRAPLITIEGFAGSLDRKYGHLLDVRGRQHLASIRRSAASLRDLTNTLLELSRVQAQPLYKIPSDVREVVDDVLQDMQGLISERGASMVLSRAFPIVLADDMALHQVFANLISNAIKYLGDQANPVVIIRYRPREREHEFSVTDNGIGIAPEHQEEIFKLFRRLPGTGAEGSGVGLTTVKRWVLRHGGRIWVESRKGQGATFKFTLPRTPADFSPSEAPGSASLAQDPEGLP